MTMKLDKEKIEPHLTKYAFFEVVPGIYSKIMDDVKYGVDFNKNEMFRLEEDNARTYKDEADENLVWLRDLCMKAMFEESESNVQEVENNSIEESHETEDAEYTEIPDNNNGGSQESTVSPTSAITGYTGDIVRPAISAVQAKQAWQEYLNMRKVILDRKDFQNIQGKDFIKKSGWRKFATFYNLTDTIVQEDRIESGDGSFIWKIKVLCTAPNGRVTEGVAICSSREKSGARIEHDVYSTAHTRAKNRAISDMIAAGEVSAEEMAV